MMSGVVELQLIEHFHRVLFGKPVNSVRTRVRDCRHLTPITPTVLSCTALQQASILVLSKTD